MPGTRTARSPARAAGTMPTRSRPPSPAAGVPPYCQLRPGRRSCAQGRWPVARAPATGWTDHDRGPQADAEERITSAHRAIEIREKRRRVLSSHPAGITLALQPTSSVSAAATHPIGQRTRRTPRSARHRWSRARRITTYRTAGQRTFSLILHVTQRDAGIGRRRSGQPHPPAPRQPGDHSSRLRRGVPGPGRLTDPGRRMIPG